VVLDGIEIVVTAKRVKHMRLVVNPDGRVRASVPRRTTKRETEAFLKEHLSWILVHREKVAHHGPISTRPLADGDTLPLWGDPLTVTLITGRSGARPHDDRVIISVQDPTDPDAVAAAVGALYRREVTALLPDIVAKWSAELGLAPTRLTVRAMRTRWGSCTTSTGAIRINPELAARHPKCLSYVVLHELAHLIEPGHGPNFQAVMDAHLPEWRAVRAELNARGQH